MHSDTPTRSAESSVFLQERPAAGVRPYTIDVDPSVLDDLRERLDATRWVELPGDAEWAYGTRRAFLYELVEYWRTGFDWRRQEARLNQLPQWTARVGATDVHFVHVRRRESGRMPLLLLHGWPDSFFRFHRVIPLLARSHHLVVPSLPGFPLTGPLRGAGPHQPTRQSADVLWRLMTEVLGYSRFGVVGGDGGSVLAQILAIDHPEGIAAIHLTDLGWHAYNADPSSLSRAEQKYLTGAKEQFLSDMAYAMVHNTRPRSLATALNDSPVGLASWIVDRFHSWSDAGDIDASFGRDELLTNVMLYWVTQTIGPSLYNYFAEVRSPSLTPADRVEQPVALALFPRDIGGAVPPRRLAERTLNVQRWTEMPRGGHFAAWEVPELFAPDVLAFFEEVAMPTKTESTTAMAGTRGHQDEGRTLIKGFHGVRYHVRDVGRAVAFYTGRLGFTLEHQQLPAFASVSLDDVQLLLSGPGASGSRPLPDGRPQEPGGWSRIVLRVADLPACIAGLKRAGLHFRNEMEVGPGGKQIQVEDPDGNPIELFEPAR